MVLGCLCLLFLSGSRMYLLWSLVGLLMHFARCDVNSLLKGFMECFDGVNNLQVAENHAFYQILRAELVKNLTILIPFLEKAL